MCPIAAPASPRRICWAGGSTTSARSAPPPPGPIASGKAKAIGLLTAERSPLFPTLTTSKEQGIAGVDSYFWTGFFFPKDTPDAIVQRLSRREQPDARCCRSRVERLRKTGIEPIAAARRSPAYLRDFMQAEMKNWAEQVKASGVPLQ